MYERNLILLASELKAWQSGGVHVRERQRWVEPGQIVPFHIAARPRVVVFPTAGCSRHSPIETHWKIESYVVAREGIEPRHADFQSLLQNALST